MSASALHRYWHENGAGPSARGKAPFALVTGSTGGMGEEWALQLAALGFNVIIQGRNKGKLETVRSLMLKSAPDADVRLLVTEATVYPNPALTQGLAKLLDEPDVRLTVVISNLGVNEMSYPKLDEQSSESVAGIVLANAFYPAEVARICLPHLKRHEPSLLVTVTSIGCWAPPPYLSPYCGTKGFDVSFSRSLHNEMICENRQVDIVCMVPGQVSSNMCLEPVSRMVPTSADWVKAGIASLRSTWWTPRPGAVVVPWGPHAWGMFFIAWAPAFMVNAIARSKVVKMRDEYLAANAKDK